MLTIGKVAALTGVSSDTLRYYEQEGLVIPSGKSEGGYRLYDDTSVRRVQFIKQAQHCGFTLSEILELLALRSRESACCGDVRRRAIEKKLQIESKIKALRVMSGALDSLITDCTYDAQHPIEDCPILAALEKTAAPTFPAANTR
ncbi:heavy metal-responsive transcriptional regulator [Paraburkholderia dilworthii]|uniref:Heavy metal-responsive transcriptional regulator n=1 Tax=Paraburkholderia dilworthii TaxID=948106 RepID=A0ABW9DIH0_9BURK